MLFGMLHSLNCNLHTILNDGTLAALFAHLPYWQGRLQEYTAEETLLSITPFFAPQGPSHQSWRGPQHRHGTG